MKNKAKFIGFSFAGLMVVATIIYAAVNPEMGMIYQSPYATLGLGMIGLGMCMETRKHQQAKASGKNCDVKN